MTSGPPREAASAALATQDLTVNYPRRKRSRRALDAVTLNIHCGEWVALLGPNGSGKSTLLKVASGQIPPSAGSCRVLDAPVADVDRASIGVVFQTVALDPRLSVAGNLHDLARLQGLEAATARERIAREVEFFGLSDRMYDRINTLSGGLARRVDFARAVLHDPVLLLLDEPTNGLDPVARQACIDRLQALHDCGDHCLLMSTHQVEEAAAASRVIMLHEGRIVADGTPQMLCDAIGPRVIRITDPRFSPPEDEGWHQQGGEWVHPIPEASNPLLQSLLARGLDLTVSRPTLADAFVRQSGTMLADRSESSP